MLRRYYPALFFSELARLTNEFLPQFTAAYYIRSEPPRQGLRAFRSPTFLALLHVAACSRMQL